MYHFAVCSHQLLHILDTAGLYISVVCQVVKSSTPRTCWQLGCHAWSYTEPMQGLTGSALYGDMTFCWLGGNHLYLGHYDNLLLNLSVLTSKEEAK